MKLTANQYNHIGITGSSSIDHRIRHKLHLTCEEYVVLDYLIFKRIVDETPIDRESVNKEIGLDWIAYKSIAEALMNRKQLVLKDGKAYPSPEVLKHFDIKEDFEYLWKIFKPNPGNKKEAFSMFKKAIRKSPLRILKECALNYAASKQGVESNYFMHLSSFLNPQFQKYLDYQNPTKSKPKEQNGRTAEWGQST